MPNSKDLFNDLIASIHFHDSPEEIKSILYLVFHHLYGFSQADVLSGKELPSVDREQLNKIISRVNLQEPIQYILGETEFYGRRFLVSPAVLIPRPETEELVALVLNDSAFRAKPRQTILDIGTGSGCLSVTLAAELPGMHVTATDISADALAVAQSNAALHKVPVSFKREDIFSEIPLTAVDLIVSNPPYITPEEKTLMHENVLRYEPALALFVPQNDPLIFYRAIARIARQILLPDGKVMVEINEQFGEEVASLFIAHGLKNVLIKKDLNKKDRIVRATY